MSGKGGVGKSAVTVNLALALADRGYRVGILDVDMHGPSVPGLLGLKTRLTARDEKILNPVFYNNSIAVVSIDFFLENRDMAIIWRGPKKTAAISQFLASVNWGKLDYLLIDSPPGTGDEHLAVLKAVPDAKCVMVTTSQEISLADVRKALSFLERVNASLFGLIENMSGFACPHCGGAIDIFSAGKGELLARDRNIPFLGRIPLDVAMPAAAERQVPLMALPGMYPAKEAFLQIAEKVVTGLPLRAMNLR
ncbi:iron-sulfur cluster carrier protein [Deltaproteobacteria bacterium]|nr:iron-sulfur cluster carrier protein [Deltaproteobacteria bacterium]